MRVDLIHVIAVEARDSALDDLAVEFDDLMVQVEADGYRFIKMSDPWIGYSKNQEPISLLMSVSLAASSDEQIEHHHGGKSATERPTGRDAPSARSVNRRSRRKAASQAKSR